MVDGFFLDLCIFQLPHYIVDRGLIIIIRNEYFLNINKKSGNPRHQIVIGK